MRDWNYRVAKFREAGQDFCAIVEAYYDDNQNVIAITGDPVGAMGENLQEVAEDLKLMVEALGKPILDTTEEDFTVAMPEAGEIH